VNGDLGSRGLPGGAGRPRAVGRPVRLGRSRGLDVAEGHALGLCARCQPARRPSVEGSTAPVDRPPSRTQGSGPEPGRLEGSRMGRQGTSRQHARFDGRHQGNERADRGRPLLTEPRWLRDVHSAQGQSRTTGRKLKCRPSRPQPASAVRSASSATSRPHKSLRSNALVAELGAAVAVRKVAGMLGSEDPRTRPGATLRRQRPDPHAAGFSARTSRTGGRHGRFTKGFVGGKPGHLGGVLSTMGTVVPGPPGSAANPGQLGARPRAGCRRHVTAHTHSLDVPPRQLYSKRRRRSPWRFACAIPG